MKISGTSFSGNFEILKFSGNCESTFPKGNFFQYKMMNAFLEPESHSPFDEALRQFLYGLVIPGNCFALEFTAIKVKCKSSKKQLSYLTEQVLL